MSSCQAHDIKISSLGLKGDREVRRVLRRALRDAWPAARRFGWELLRLCELHVLDEHVGYTNEDRTIYVKVRDPVRGHGSFYPYSFILATLLHELTHLSFEGHGKAFYRRLAHAAAACGAEPAVRREVHSHVCSELLNAVCENDAPRAKALLAVLPEAARCRPLQPGGQLPLEYAAHHGRVNLTKLLIQARADPNSCGEAGVPPLARAASQGNTKTLRVLLDAGASRGMTRLPELQRREVQRVTSLPVLRVERKERSERSDPLVPLAASLACTLTQNAQRQHATCGYTMIHSDEFTLE